MRLFVGGMKITAKPPSSALNQTFILKDFTLAYSNGLRRALHADVQTVCFEKAVFQTYAGELPAEFVAHRIGLIPIVAPVSILEELAPFYACPNLTSQDHGMNCDTCTVRARIDVPASESARMVTDQDVVFERREFQVFSVYHKQPPIPIILIAPGQHFVCELYAYKAPGRVHAKFSPVAAVTLKPKPVIRIDKIEAAVQGDADVVRRLQELCPRGVFVSQGGSLKLIKAELCVFCDSCVRTNIKGIESPVSVEADYSEITMDVESVGSLSCAEIVRQGIISLVRSCEAVVGEIDVQDGNVEAIEEGVDALQ